MSHNVVFQHPRVRLLVWFVEGEHWEPTVVTAGGEDKSGVAHCKG